MRHKHKSSGSLKFYITIVQIYYYYKSYFIPVQRLLLENGLTLNLIYLTTS